MRRAMVVIAIVVAVVLVAWGGLTLWVERKGAERMAEYGQSTRSLKALIVYDADPIYNLDEQVCLTFAQALEERGWYAKVATVAAAGQLNANGYDLYVFCANTYNWRPDWSTTGFIKQAPIEGKAVVAITLGAGSTAASQRILEEIIGRKGAVLKASRSFWLWRPNDDQRMKESNLEVCLSQVKEWALGLGASLLR